VQAVNLHTELGQEIGRFYGDPLGYVMFNFPWGQTGTPLEQFTGPRKWQRDFLIDLGTEIRKRNFDGMTPVMPIDEYTASGHGIGKSALSAMLCKFVFDTRPYCRGTVTANTAPQLRSKTWAEVGKWHRLSLTRNWGIYAASQANMSLRSPIDPENWFIVGLTCREENSESFAGQHAVNSTSFYLFDEGSSVPDKIYEVSDGGLTDGEPMRFVFGNPTRSTGRFRNAFKVRGNHRTRQVDSRDVEGTNKALFEEWLRLYGDDSDFFRVRVKGQFPRVSSMQFIGDDLVAAACARQPYSEVVDPLIMGVDVARFGDDQSVLRWRRGYDLDVIEPIRLQGVDTMTLASVVNLHALGSLHTKGMRADAVFVDETGVGGGVIDRLHQLSLRTAKGVNFADKAIGGVGMRGSDGERYSNRRAEMYGGLRQWLRNGGAIDPQDLDLQNELTAIEYGFNAQNEIQLERKEDTKKRIGRSPDEADAAALTFAEPVLKQDVRHNIEAHSHDSGRQDYDPLADMRR
jgi:hypothetical protein